ncbi:MAG: hypothetical protein EOP51_10275 [Sphingobacteriales bacterium]|nr:MAG: hypothetical protein EOP51_10275 [Sphingobacteriales bacterium]
MKSLKILSIALATVLGFSAKAQDTEVPTPEFKNKVMYVKKDNTLVELENTDLQTDLKTSMAGSSKVFIKASGNHASVKHSGSPKNRFVIWIEAGTDPQSAVELLKFDADKKTRKMTVNTMGLAKDKEIPKQKLVFTKVKDGVYLISPSTQLEAGEYMFMVNRPNVDFMSAASGNSGMKGFAFYVEGSEE